MILTERLSFNNKTKLEVKTRVSGSNKINLSSILCLYEYWIQLQLSINHWWTMDTKKKPVRYLVADTTAFINNTQLQVIQWFFRCLYNFHVLNTTSRSMLILSLRRRT